MIFRTCRIALACLLLALPPAAAAATVQVSPGGDVQAALDAASPGDVVLLLDGVHPMPAMITMRDGVALEGESRDGTVLDGGLTASDPAAENHVWFPNTITDARTRLANLTITGGHSSRGGGVRVNGATAGEIVGNRIHGNHAELSGSGILVRGDVPAAFLVAFNLIHDNADSDETFSAHALEMIGAAAPTIQNNTIVYNDDNGVFVPSGADWPLLVNNLLARNGTDNAPPVVLDPETGEPVSGVSENVGRGTCYFATIESAPGVRISHNLFFGNQRSAVLVTGMNGGDYENPLDLEALESNITGSAYLPRGVSDLTLFADPANRDFRIREGSAAYQAGDPAIAGVDHIGAEQETVPALAVPTAGPLGRGLLLLLLAAAGLSAARPR